MTASQGTAFGFAVESREPIPGIAGCAPPAGAPRVRVEVEGPVAPPLPGEPGSLLDRMGPDGSLVAAVRRDERGAYRIYGAGFGSYDVSADATGIVCHPHPDCEPWLWQRFLMSQALPLAATICGVEPFHAGGVAIGGRVVAVAGRSGIGKSSLSLTLASRGHGFQTDDVLALASGPEGVVCKPGPGAANVRDPMLRELAARGAPPFGDVLGETPDGVRALVSRDGRDRPLGAMYFLDHAREHGEVRFEPTTDPQLLLGHTFNVLVRTRERLEAQLGLCAAIAATVPLFSVRVPHGTPVADLATRLEEHALAPTG